MKKKFLAACVLAVCLVAFAGCSNSSPADTQSGAHTDAPPSAEPSPESFTVSPLPVTIDLNDLNDCTVAVSFQKGDAFVDDTGVMRLKAAVYTYDLYDMVDISKLKAGDRITICRQDVKVTSLERSENGAVIINGGLENGGYEVVSDDNTVFYADGFDDMKSYYELGEVTLPVSQDFVFEDSSDLEKGPRTYYPGDFLTDDAGIEYNFTPNNTTVTIQDGFVIAMHRVYNP